MNNFHEIDSENQSFHEKLIAWIYFIACLFRLHDKLSVSLVSLRRVKQQQNDETGRTPQVSEREEQAGELLVHRQFLGVGKIHEGKAEGRIRAPVKEAGISRLPAEHAMIYLAAPVSALASAFAAFFLALALAFTTFLSALALASAFSALASALAVATSALASAFSTLASALA